MSNFSLVLILDNMNVLDYYAFQIYSRDGIEVREQSHLLHKSLIALKHLGLLLSFKLFLFHFLISLIGRFGIHVNFQPSAILVKQRVSITKLNCSYFLNSSKVMDGMSSISIYLRSKIYLCFTI